MRLAFYAYRNSISLWCTLADRRKRRKKNNNNYRTVDPKCVNWIDKFHKNNPLIWNACARRRRTKHQSHHMYRTWVNIITVKCIYLKTTVTMGHTISLFFFSILDFCVRKFKVLIEGEESWRQCRLNWMKFQISNCYWLKSSSRSSTIIK